MVRRVEPEKRRGLNICILLLVGLALLFSARSVAAHGEQGVDVLHHIGFDQRLNEQVPLDLVFYDEAGRSVRLGDFFTDKPVILVMGYYECPNLCSLINEELAKGLQGVKFNPGTDFEIVSVSIDPRETPQVAAAKKPEYLAHYDRPGAEEGWHLLTGEEPQIQQLAQAIGFRYAYDESIDQYAHASGITILTPSGRVARYIYGLTLPTMDLRLALVEASANKIGTPVEQVLLLCFKYDAMAGTYSPLIMNIVRLASIAAVVVLGIFLAVMFRRDRRRYSEAQG